MAGKKKVIGPGQAQAWRRKLKAGEQLTQLDQVLRQFYNANQRLGRIQSSGFAYLTAEEYKAAMRGDRAKWSVEGKTVAEVKQMLKTTNKEISHYHRTGSFTRGGKNTKVNIGDATIGAEHIEAYLGLKSKKTVTQAGKLRRLENKARRNRTSKNLSELRAYKKYLKGQGVVLKEIEQISRAQAIGASARKAADLVRYAGLVRAKYDATGHGMRNPANAGMVVTAADGTQVKVGDIVAAVNIFEAGSDIRDEKSAGVRAAFVLLIERKL